MESENEVVCEREDTSDEHYLSRHDAVLRNMRERWALLSRLKNEVRREGSVSVSGLKRQRSGEVFALPFPDTEEFPVDSNLSLTPLIKKRGRPPKFHKIGSSKVNGTAKDSHA